MASFTCAGCGVQWPQCKEAERCPRCEHPTARNMFREPQASVEAVRFERRYRLREEARQAAGELSPDVQGRLEARELLREKAALL